MPEFELPIDVERRLERHRQELAQKLAELETLQTQTIPELELRKELVSEPWREVQARRHAAIAALAPFFGGTTDRIEVQQWANMSGAGAAEIARLKAERDAAELEEREREGVVQHASSALTNAKTRESDLKGEVRRLHTNIEEDEAKLERLRIEMEVRQDPVRAGLKRIADSLGKRW